MHLSSYLNNANSFVGHIAGGSIKTLYPIGDNRLARDVDGKAYNARNVADSTKFGQRVYIEHPDGVHQLESALRQAGTQGRQRKFMLEKDFLALAKDVHVQLLAVSSIDDIISSDLPGDLMAAQQMLRYCRAEPLRNSKEQLEHCLLFQDSLGRFNIGVLRCRSGQVPPKTMAQVRAIDRWIRAFFNRQLRLQDLRLEFSRQLEEMLVGVKMTLQEFSNSNEPPSADDFVGFASDLRQWKNLRPYNYFVAAALPLFEEVESLFHLPVRGISVGDVWAGEVVTKLLKLRQILELKLIQMKLIGIDLFLSDKSLIPMGENARQQRYGYYDAAERDISVRRKYSVAHKLQEAVTIAFNQLDALDTDERMADEKIRGQIWSVYHAHAKVWEKKRGIFFRKNIFTHPDQHQELRELFQKMIAKISELAFTPPVSA